MHAAASASRIVIGLDTHKDIHVAVALDHLGRRLGERHVPTFDGRYYTLREASLRTVVAPVPVWLAAGGPQMFELTVRYAGGWSWLSEAPIAR
jgi:alkanesulfonate monooxygenase SsuD/methylene tetrahydromethanopterin reductase-like flavin-dependent oxidoreductase (luciferase family)